MSIRQVFNKCKIGIVLFICGAVVGGLTVFYIQKSNYENRNARLVIEASAFLVPPLLALQNGDNKGAETILKDLLNRAILVLMNADKNNLKDYFRQLWIINDCRIKLNCKFKDELVEQKADNFFKYFEQNDNNNDDNDNNKRKIKVLRVYNE